MHGLNVAATKQGLDLIPSLREWGGDEEERLGQGLQVLTAEENAASVQGQAGHGLHLLVLGFHLFLS